MPRSPRTPTRPLARCGLPGLLGALALLGAGAAAQAQSSNVLVYGLLDAAVGRFQDAGTRATWRSESGRLSTSLIGVRGSDDLGGGLRARFQLEHELRLDQGLPGRRDGDAFWGRQASVGLQGAFGATTLGRHPTPLFLQTQAFNPFGDSYGFSPSVRQHFLGSVIGDAAWSNSLAYTNNGGNEGGLGLRLLANAGEGSGEANLSGSAHYVAGSLELGLAWQRVHNAPLPLPAGFSRQDAYQLAAAHSLGPARLQAQWSYLHTRATQSGQARLLELGATVPFGNGRLLAAWGHARREAGSASTQRNVSLGWNQALSNRSDVYAVVMTEQASGLSSGQSLAGGMRLRF